ncbi:MAG: hypothetical protein WD066_14255 [Planctomycetaceae bacterium]
MYQPPNRRKRRRGGCTFWTFILCALILACHVLLVFYVWPNLDTLGEFVRKFVESFRAAWNAG